MDAELGNEPAANGGTEGNPQIRERDKEAVSEFRRFLRLRRKLSLADNQTARVNRTPDENHDNHWNEIGACIENE